MIKFIITLDDVRKNRFNTEELKQLEYLLERTLDEADVSLAKRVEVTSKKLIKFWEKGTSIRVDLEQFGSWGVNK